MTITEFRKENRTCFGESRLRGRIGERNCNTGELGYLQLPRRLHQEDIPHEYTKRLNGGIFDLTEKIFQQAGREGLSEESIKRIIVYGIQTYS